MFLILWFSWLEKERKNQFKIQTPRLSKLSVFLKPPTLHYSNSPHPPRLLVFDIFSNGSYIPPPSPPPPPPSIRDLRVRKLKGRGKPFKVINWKI